MRFPVFNAGPLIALGRINYLHLLPEIFGRVIVPRAVFVETTSQTGLPGAIQLGEALWLETHDVRDMIAVERLLLSLEKGESEAIILAQELSSRLFMDERRGRLIATAMGVPVTGSVGILITAKQRNLIPQITPLLNLLIEKGIHISGSLYDEARIMADEK